MYLPSSKIEVRSLRRNSRRFYGVPVYVTRLLFLRGKSGNSLAARQLLASQKIVNCEWIRSISETRYKNINPFLPRCPFGALFYSIVHNSLNICPIETLPVMSVGALAQLFIMVSNLMIRPVLTELREFKVDPSNSPN